MEGFGGPVNLDQYHLAGIDPCLEDCCRREVCRMYLNSAYIHVFIYVYIYIYIHIHIYIYICSTYVCIILFTVNPWLYESIIRLDHFYSHFRMYYTMPQPIYFLIKRN